MVLFQGIYLLYLLTVLYLCRIHGNIGRKPPRALSKDELMKVISFIKNYAAVHTILLPGRIPGLKDYERTNLLPCTHQNDRSIWNMQSPVGKWKLEHVQKQHFTHFGVDIYHTYAEPSQ